MLIAALAAVFVALLVFKAISDFLRFRNLPGPTQWPLVGALPQFLWNMSRKNEWFTELAVANGGRAYFFAIPGRENWILTNPADFEYFMKTNMDNFVKGSHDSCACVSRSLSAYAQLMITQAG